MPHSGRTKLTSGCWANDGRCRVFQRSLWIAIAMLVVWTAVSRMQKIVVVARIGAVIAETVSYAL
jgi:hypothetical protein